MRPAAVIPLGATLAALAAGLTVGAVPAGAARTSAPDAVPGVVRVNQQGYLPSEPKQARLMTRAPVHHATFRVLDDSDAVVLTGRVPRHATGSWSHRYPAVYRLDLGGLHTDGRYRVEVDGDAKARSPWFF